MSQSLAVGGAVASPAANARVQPTLPDPRRKLGDRLSARAPALAFPLTRRRALAAGPATGPGPEASGPTVPEPVSGCPASAPRSGPGFLAPRCAALGQLAMGLTMGYMLIMLL